jgi:hypothetical protein
MSALLFIYFRNFTFLQTFFEKIVNTISSKILLVLQYPFLRELLANDVPFIEYFATVKTFAVSLTFPRNYVMM